MAPIKRKGGPDKGSSAHTHKTQAATAEERGAKRQKKSENVEIESQRKIAGPSSSAGNPSSTLSALGNEEPSFPRGGASILTPLEHKQIQLEATRDVLFEQHSHKKRGLGVDGDSENGDVDMDSSLKTSKSKRGPKAKGKKGQINAITEEPKIRTEGLSYKRIVEGSIILGQISQINSHDIALALPNNLTGYVPLTSISNTLTARLEMLLGEADDSGEEELTEDKDINLRSCFSLGQYLRAYVTSTGDGVGTTSKKHIELSLNPRQANLGLKKSDLVINSTVQASVRSVEDHGLVMDLGLGHESVRGFMSSKEVGHNIDIAHVEEGAVFLCLVMGLNSSGDIVKLSADPQRIGNIKKSNHLVDAPTVDSFTPGTAVEFLITEVTPSGIAGKVMGLLDVTADLVHSGAGPSGKDLIQKYKNGNKMKGRIICTFPTIEPRKLGISLLDHVLAFRPHTATSTEAKTIESPLAALPISTIVEKAKVVMVEQGVGLFVDVGVSDTRGFVHISRITDGKIEALSESTGLYKLGSAHKARILGYNPMDGLFLVSMEQRIIDQPFLRVEDIQIGEVVKGKVEKLVVNSVGIGGILVNLAEGITGLVPEIHMADIHLQHPEKKFKEGMSVKARVLSTNPEKRHLRLTLKKTLVNSDAPVWKSFADILPGAQSPGTLVNLLPSGAVVQFYGSVRGFLPVSEMSEAYIHDPKQHFRTGQVVNVHVLSVDPEEGNMILSCKDQAEFGAAQQIALQDLKIGSTVTGTVVEKSTVDIRVELHGSALKARLPVGHIGDGSEQKNSATMNSIRIGQTLQNLLVLEKVENKRLITLTNKASLISAAREGKLLKSFDDLVEGLKVDGFVRNITLTAVFVEFAGGLTGLLPKGQLPEEAIRLPDFGMRRYQSISTTVMTVDHGQRRFLLTLKDTSNQSDQPVTATVKGKATVHTVSNAIDEKSKTINDYTLGTLSKAKIVSVKDTQMNVQLADGIQGRVDVSEIFDSWEDIKDRKHPLHSFSTKQVLPVRVLGIHDSRNHRFLPISHSGRAPVFELTAKPSHQNTSKLNILSLDQVTIGSTWLAFVNNIAADCLWVNISPNIRGRIRITDVSDDVSLLQDLEKNFPLGSALRVHVIAVDVASNRLDLSARSGLSTAQLTMEELSEGMILPGRVTKITERQLMVQLNDTISAPVHLIDLADDHSEANTTIFERNQIIRVCITSLDIPNKKISLSTRPSRVLNSSLPVKDPEIRSISQLKVDQVIRGFVKNVADNGIFVALGPSVTAYVRISDLSDSFIKDWKSEFQVDQLVKGKIIIVDPLLNHVQLSLKQSVMNKHYVAPITFNDIKIGQIVTGKVRKVEDFGVFIVVDGSANVSGLCHRSEMAEQRVEDVKKLYDEGDVVKAKVLKVDTERRRISFGLKASYFHSEDIEGQHDSDDSIAEDAGGIQLIDAARSESDPEGSDNENGVDVDDVQDIDNNTVNGGRAEHGDKVDLIKPASRVTGLSTSGFDWTGGIVEDKQSQPDTESETEITEKKKKRRRPEIKVDMTADLDANGPQSVADFERLLLGQPDSSYLWLKYMAFQLELSEIAKARDIAERAIRTIGIREESDKMNVWVAMLNLENTYGNGESVDDVFKRACQYNDAQEIHERLTSIYIQSGKHEVSYPPCSLFVSLTKYSDAVAESR